jgi:hypothetical protein
MYKSIFYSAIVLLFSSCAVKKVNVATTATVIFKTPYMKFYDKGFINKYDNYINIQIYNLGKMALNLDIYPHKICKGMFECMSAKEFNHNYLNSDYKDDFLYKLFHKNKIYYKNKKDKIFIKVQ